MMPSSVISMMRLATVWVSWWSWQEKMMLYLKASRPLFSAAMLSSLGETVPENDFAALDALSAFAKTPVPAPLDALRAREERFKTVVEKDEMRESVRNWLVK